MFLRHFSTGGVNGFVPLQCASTASASSPSEAKREGEALGESSSDISLLDCKSSSDISLLDDSSSRDPDNSEELSLVEFSDSLSLDESSGSLALVGPPDPRGLLLTKGFGSHESQRLLEGEAGVASPRLRDGV